MLLSAGNVTANENKDSLGRAYWNAVQLLRSAQQPDGNWIAELTNEPTYKQPITDPDVTGTAMITLLLRPIAGQSCISDLLRKSQAFLARQIEPTGLVRFYGYENQLANVRNSQMIPDLGDTSAVWLAADLRSKADLAKLQRAMAHIEQFRQGEGAYGTWLSDYWPGVGEMTRNPVDVNIMMDLYLLKQSYELEGAQPICQFLQRHAHEERYWIWFRYAPLMPRLMLRQMAVAGCPLHVPGELLEPEAEHQEPYLQMVELLLVLEAAEPGESRGAQLARQSKALLQRLATDNFAYFREKPPLVYNKDIESPRGFYWMPEFAYALWLRLANATAAHAGVSNIVPLCK